MRTLIHRLKSHLQAVFLFADRLIDNLYRLVMGMPRLKRCQVTASLYLGSQYSAVGLRKLKALGITSIVNMREHSVYAESRYEGIKYLHLPTVDNTPPSIDVLVKGGGFISDAISDGGKVYVHCRQGLGRGPTMAIAYLLRTGLTFEDAFSLVKAARPFIDPRPAQLERLKELETYYEEHPSGQSDIGLP